jgi:hemoglobin-like flavoprotein
MNRTLVDASWNQLDEHDDAIGQRFFELLTHKYPQYLELLAEGGLKEQNESLPLILEIVTWMEPQSDDVPPYMSRLAQLYKEQGITLDDMENFREVMLEVLDEFGSQYVSDWSRDYLEAWNDAFEVQVIPAILSSMDEAA